jgi:hypothetical protein
MVLSLRGVCVCVVRSFGDVALRRFGVTSEPELGVQFNLRRDLEFLLLACDGLWARWVGGAVDDMEIHSTRCSSSCVFVYMCVYRIRYDHNNVAAFVRNRLWAGESWCQVSQCCCSAVEP